MKKIDIKFRRTPQNVEEVIKAANDHVGVAVMNFSGRTLTLAVAKNVDCAKVEEELLELADTRDAVDVEPCI